MRLKVTGVEAIEITDPGSHMGRRKHIDPGVLQELKGQTLTTEELKGRFGYARTTALCDTQLKHLVEPVNQRKGEPYSEKRTLWRVL